MAITPRRFRNLPPAVASMPNDILPVSQMDPETGVATTRGMTRETLESDLIAAVAEARAELVAEFEERDVQLAAAVADLQEHQTWIDSAIVQIETIDTGLQAAVDALETKVEHPAQWSEIAAKPSTFPPSAHNHSIADVVGLQAALDAKLTPPIPLGAPNARTPVFGTAYQATDNTKPSFISAMIDAAYTVTVASTLSDTVELRIGPVQATVANGTGGTAVAVFRASLTGIALVIGLGLGQRNQLSAMLPTGWWWAIRRVAGTTATITSATDQSLG